MEEPKIKVLIADDDETALMLLSRGIEAPHFEIATAASGTEALDRLASGRYDILLSDIGMPAPSGLELTKIVKERYPGTDVIILTAYTTMDTVVQALEAGAYDFMTKPFDLSLLKAALRRCVEKRRLQAQLAAGGIGAGVKQVAERVADLRSKVLATEFGAEHESCGDFARRMLDDLDARFKALGIDPKATA